MPTTAQVQQNPPTITQLPPISGLLDYSIAFFILFSIAKELWQIMKRKDADEGALIKLLIDDLRVNNREGFTRIVEAILTMKDSYRVQAKELEVFINSTVKEQTVIYSQQIGELNRISLATHTRIDELERRIDEALVSRDKLG